PLPPTGPPIPTFYTPPLPPCPALPPPLVPPFPPTYTHQINIIFTLPPNWGPIHYPKPAAPSPKLAHPHCPFLLHPTGVHIPTIAQFWPTQNKQPLGGIHPQLTQPQTANILLQPPNWGPHLIPPNTPLPQQN
ncbi:extensin-like, partial [Penaeus monodon]|uniref:extensin-like n=1 Tax=Penaeus monodon TaxID=6687 RepID=UPI0018A7DDEF